MAHRARVLGMYRYIMRGARTWEGGPAEQQAIRDEARTLFRRNQHAPDSEVPDYLFEAQTRVELARHYRIPHARLFYAPKGTTGDRESILSHYVPGAYRKSYAIE